MKKLILALVTTARKLSPYFQVHTIEIPTEYPMKQVLHKPETSRRLMKWAIEPSEFDIEYKPKKSNKRAYLGRLRHGIHLGRACRGYSNDAQPPHLEDVRRRGRQCSMEWCRANSDLSMRNRYRVCAQIWVLSLQQRGRV